VSVKITGEACCRGEACRPDRTPRPVYQHGYCWPCWASLSSMERSLAEWESDAIELDLQVDVSISEVATALAVLQRIWDAS
jgi:hypothetical protein